MFTNTKKTKRVSVWLNKEEEQILERVRIGIYAQTKSEVLRRALHAYHAMLEMDK